MGFGRRVTLDQLPDKSLATLRRLSDEDLAEFIAGWEPDSADHILGRIELQRRSMRAAELRASIALAISAFALIFSIYVYFNRDAPSAPVSEQLG